jgi:DNA (cytosine-5)-methyltransferase 1
VPSSLGFAVGKHIKKLMDGEEIVNPKNFPYSRYKNTDEENWEKMIRAKIK